MVDVRVGTDIGGCVGDTVGTGVKLGRGELVGAGDNEADMAC